jgi:glycosyltransferase involved in cell wall biosynthesis
LRILFYSLWGPGWGGCEELWSRTAIEIANSTPVHVLASVPTNGIMHPRVAALEPHVQLRLRRFSVSQAERVFRRIALQNADIRLSHLRQSLRAEKPSLVVICEGGSWPDLSVLETIVEAGVKFAVISQANSDEHWLPDEMGERMLKVAQFASAWYFVSEQNRKLAEDQLGSAILKSEVVWNPISTWMCNPEPWPEAPELRMACVARLHPPSKGQDLLFAALSAEKWRARAWTLDLFGDGPQRLALQRLAVKHGIGERVRFRGFIDDVQAIWRECHILTLTSRYEGMPLVLLECLMSARPALVTAVAGNAEPIIPKKTGFIARTPTVRDVSKALDEVWQMRSHLQLMGAAARRHLKRLVPERPEAVLARKILALLN